MRRSLIPRFFLEACLPVAFWLAAPASADGPSGTRQFWPEVDGYIRSSEETRVLLQYAAARQNDLETYAEGKVGGFVDFYTLPLLRFEDRRNPDAAQRKLLMFRAGYLYSRTPHPGGTTSTDHVPTFLSDARYSLPWKLDVVDRNRFDLQFIDGVFTPRYRNRLRVERPFNVGRFEVAPYVSAEVFYEWKYGAFDRFRYTAGADWTVARFLVVESYYTRQKSTRSLPEYVNALGLKLEFYFR